MKTRPRLSAKNRCHICNAKRAFVFRKKFWCEACLDKRMNVDDPKEMHDQAMQHYFGRPGLRTQI